MVLENDGKIQVTKVVTGRGLCGLMAGAWEKGLVWWAKIGTWMPLGLGFLLSSDPVHSFLLQMGFLCFSILAESACPPQTDILS